MPRASAFNPTHFSSRPSHQELIFKEMVRALGNGENYTDDFDSLAMARVYANAMAFGRCKYTIERAGSQFHPALALELLPALEREYGLVPVSGSSIAERRAELAIAMRIARGARRTNVEDMLTELFGDDFVEYITIPAADAVLSTDGPSFVGYYPEPGTPRSIFRLIDPVTRLAEILSLRIEVVVNGTGAEIPLVEDQRVVIDPGSLTRCETFTVREVTGAGSLFVIQASFDQPHSRGTLLATGRHPNLASTKRHNLVILSAEAAADARSRKKAHRTIRRALRGVSTWSIADDSGPFTVGGGRIGITTIGAV